MSNDNKKKAPASEEKAEKIVTKYDLKMQKRREEKEREERARKITTTVGVLVLLAILCFVLSFPIRSYISQHKAFIKVGNEEVTRVEFDYCYNTVVNNYVNTYSQYLSWIGLDTTKDLAAQSYDGTRSWKDYFEEMTVDALKRSKALKADAKAAGFTADVSEDYNLILEQYEQQANTAGVSVNKYLKQTFGTYASASRIKPYVEEALYVQAYYDKLSKDMTPDAATIQAKYEEDPKKYDSVDYRIKTFEAELPTEPTALADPDAVASQSTDENATYTPSEAEIAKAMEDAKAQADQATNSITSTGDQVTGILYDSANDDIRDWLFEDGRKAGDVTVIEDSDAHKYYCLAFEKRYRDETPTADVRLLLADTVEEAQSMLDAWTKGGASEEYFIELCDGTYADKKIADGGLLEAVSKDEDLYEELLNWIFADGRKVGDCEIVTVPDVINFVVYYSGENQPQWYKTIESTERSNAVEEYVDKIMETCQVSDPDKNLNYLVLKQQEAEAAASAAAESNAVAPVESDAEGTQVEENSGEE